MPICLVLLHHDMPLLHRLSPSAHQDTVIGITARIAADPGTELTRSARTSGHRAGSSLAITELRLVWPLPVQPAFRWRSGPTPPELRCLVGLISEHRLRGRVQRVIGIEEEPMMRRQIEQRASLP